ncbi:MAG: hypothetical protein JO168_01070 [Solirubrobacterales bacterium]|nr:hypothetical protein [Solirubrobacterales bacterium]
MIIDNDTQAVAEIGVRLIDDAYLAWLAAETDSELALRAWSADLSGSRSGAYSAYRAALDREEAAARDLERLSELARTCNFVLSGHGNSAEGVS